MNKEPNYTLALLALTAALGVLIFNYFVLPDLPTTTVPVAHAAETIKTNRDYCIEWREGVWNLQGASRTQMVKLCNKYGV